jgi:hypothetical protein
MTELLLHGRPVATVFDLLGDKEDDVTYSFGWALANSERLVRALLASAFGAGIEQGEVTALLLQQSIPGAGRTDIEIETERLHLILEAKRGWELPSQEQLAQYAGRSEPGRQPILLAVSECSPAGHRPGFRTISPVFQCAISRGATSPPWLRTSPAQAEATPNDGCCESSSAT